MVSKLVEWEHDLYRSICYDQKEFLNYSENNSVDPNGALNVSRIKELITQHVANQEQLNNLRVANNIPDNCIHFKYTFVFTTIDKRYVQEYPVALDLIRYTINYDKTLNQDRMNIHNLMLKEGVIPPALVGTCCLLAFVANAFKTKYSPLSHQIATFVKDIDIATLQADINHVKNTFKFRLNTLNGLFYRQSNASEPVFDINFTPLFITFIPLCENLQTFIIDNNNRYVDVSQSCVRRMVLKQIFEHAEISRSQFPQSTFLCISQHSDNDDGSVSGQTFLSVTCEIDRIIGLQDHPRVLQEINEIAKWITMPKTVRETFLTLEHISAVHGFFPAFLYKLKQDDYVFLVITWIEQVLLKYIEQNRSNNVMDLKYFNENNELPNMDSVNASNLTIFIIGSSHSLESAINDNTVKRMYIQFGPANLSVEDFATANSYKLFNIINRIRAFLEFLLRHDVNRDEVFIVCDYNDVQFEINRMVYEIVHKVIVSNEALKNVFDYKVFKLLPEILENMPTVPLDRIQNDPMFRSQLMRELTFTSTVSLSEFKRVQNKFQRFGNE